jgi:CDP-diacylglycerol--glycerol-3-phosphate 3-phosphatidyltransferase
VNSLPLLLTLSRAALAPVLLLLAWHPPAYAAFGACLVVALLSDIFDGVIARRLGIATPALRRLDSIADSLFYVAAVAVAWRLYPGAIRARWLPIGVLVALELLRYLVDWLKFRREAAYHMWSSKCWGLCLFAGFFMLLARGVDGWAFSLAVYVGIVADLEGLAISIALDRWQSDVPSIVHALRLRRRQ